MAPVPARARRSALDRSPSAREVSGVATGFVRTALRGALAIVNHLVPKRAGACLVAGFPDVEDGILAVSAELVASGRSVTALVGSPVPPGFYDERVRVLPRSGLRAVWAFLRSAHVVVSHGVFDHVVRSDRQVLVYTWHGESPGKTVDGYFGTPPKPYSYAPVLSSTGQAFRAAEFGLPPTRVPVLGAARNDRMLRASRTRAREALGEPDDRTLLLWMPTYRKSRVGDDGGRRDSTAGYAGLPYGKSDLLALDEWLGEQGLTVRVKLHPVEASSYRLGTRHIVPLDGDELVRAGLSTYTVLPAFDGLITDVSSIWIDWLLLDRPVVFAFPDIDEYRERRGLEVESWEDWVPGTLVRTPDELRVELRELAEGRDPHKDRRAAARRQLHRFEDDRSAERLVGYLFPVR